MSDRLSLREALVAVVATYNGTLSGDSSPHALASAIVDSEAALAAPDELAASEQASVEQCVRDILQSAFDEGLIHLLDANSDGVAPQEMSSGDLVGPANVLEKWAATLQADRDALAERVDQLQEAVNEAESRANERGRRIHELEQRLYGDRELWCDKCDDDAKSRAQQEADANGVVVHVNVHGTRRHTVYPSRIAELERDAARLDWHPLADRVAGLVEELSDPLKWNWTTGIGSSRDAADRVLKLMARVGLIEHRRHPLGGNVYRFNGELYGRVGGLESFDSALKP